MANKQYIKREDLCDYILEYAENHTKPLSRLSLNYVLYILYIMFLTKFDKPIYGKFIRQHDFTKWKLGPVVVDEYFRHTFEPTHQIKGVTCDKNLGEYFSPKEEFFIDAVLDRFTNKSLGELMDIVQATYGFRHTKLKERIDWHDIIRSIEYFQAFNIKKGFDAT